MRLESSGSSPFRGVLCDVARVLHLWDTSESFRLQSIISSFRFVVSFAVLQSCVRGEDGKFVSGGTESIDGGVIACVVAVASVATRHPEVKFAFVERVVVCVRSRVGRTPIAVGRRVATCAVVAVSSQFVGKCASLCFKYIEGCPTVVKIQHGWTTRIVFVVLLLQIVVLSCAFCRFHHRVVTVRFDSSDDVVWSPSASQSWHVVHVHVSMLLFFFHFASLILSRVVCVCCEVCFVVLCVRLFWGFLRTD